MRQNQRLSKAHLDIINKYYKNNQNFSKNNDTATSTSANNSNNVKSKNAVRFTRDARDCGQKDGDDDDDAGNNLENDKQVFEKDMAESEMVGGSKRIVAEAEGISETNGFFYSLY